MKRILLLFGLLIVMHVPISCFHCPGQPFPQPPPEYYTVTEIETFAGFITEDLRFRYDSSELASEAVLVFRISDFTTSQVAEATKPAGFSFSSAAYACEPPTPQLIPTQSLESLTITAEETVYANGLAYNPGEDLADLFGIYQDSYNNREFSAEEYITAQNEDPVNYFARLSGTPFMRFRQSPDSTIHHPFIVSIKYRDDPNVLEAVSDSLYISD